MEPNGETGSPFSWKFAAAALHPQALCTWSSRFMVTTRGREIAGIHLWTMLAREIVDGSCWANSLNGDEEERSSMLQDRGSFAQISG